VHCEVPHKHWPPEQTSLARQRWLHAPQLFGSFVVLAQPELQQVSPAEQTVPLHAQAQSAHASGVVQAWLHMPQLPLLVRGSTQVVPQQISVFVQKLAPHAQPLAPAHVPLPQQAVPAEQALPVPHLQTPPLQVSPGLQAWPQSPQWNASFCRSTQPTPAQQVEPLPHAEPLAQRQVAPEQLSPVGAQVTPQPPQFAGSDCTDAHWAEQHCWFGSHAAVPQR